MFKKIFGAIVGLIALVIVILTVMDNMQVNPITISKTVVSSALFDSKEIRLKVKFLKIIPLGTADLKNLGIVRYGRKKVYHLVAEANTLPILSNIFKAKARAESFIDVGKIHSLVFLQHLEVSNKESEDKKIIYDQEKNIMIIGDEERKILPNSQDPLSAIFYLQKEKFYLGKVITLYINTNQKNYDLNTVIKDKQKLVIDGMRFDLWRLTADVRRHDKSPRHSSSFDIWFLEDSRSQEKMPILIKAMTNIGPVTAYLVSRK
jgi:hypothetical protein